MRDVVAHDRSDREPSHRSVRDGRRDGEAGLQQLCTAVVTHEEGDVHPGIEEEGSEQAADGAGADEEHTHDAMMLL